MEKKNDGPLSFFTGIYSLIQISAVGIAILKGMVFSTSREMVYKRILQPQEAFVMKSPVNEDYIKVKVPKNVASISVSISARPSIKIQIKKDKNLIFNPDNFQNKKKQKFSRRFFNWGGGISVACYGGYKLYKHCLYFKDSSSSSLSVSVLQTIQNHIIHGETDLSSEAMYPKKIQQQLPVYFQRGLGQFLDSSKNRRQLQARIKRINKNPRYFVRPMETFCFDLLSWSAYWTLVPEYQKRHYNNYLQSLHNLDELCGFKFQELDARYGINGCTPFQKKLDLPTMVEAFQNQPHDSPALIENCEVFTDSLTKLIKDFWTLSFQMWPYQLWP